MIILTYDPLTLVQINTTRMESGKLATGNSSGLFFDRLWLGLCSNTVLATYSQPSWGMITVKKAIKYRKSVKQKMSSSSDQSIKSRSSTDGQHKRYIIQGSGMHA